MSNPLVAVCACSGNLEWENRDDWEDGDGTKNESKENYGNYVFVKKG